MRILIIFLFIATAMAQPFTFIDQAWLGKIASPQGTVSFVGTNAITSGTGFSARNNIGGSAGFTFKVFTNCTVTTLGVVIPAGGTQTHRTCLLNASGTVLLAVTNNWTGLSGTNFFIPNGTASLTTGNFYWVMTELFNAGDSWYDDTSTLAFNANLTLVTSTYDLTLEWPPVIAHFGAHTGNAAYVYPNFKYTIP